MRKEIPTGNICSDVIGNDRLPFAKLSNRIVGLKGSDTLILRGYSSNVRHMLQVLETLEKAPRPYPVRLEAH